MITLCERGDAAFPPLFDALSMLADGALRIGVTGPAGAGKSTVVSSLARAYRAESQRVGIVAVDPTSPFTGGALLGDRVRMGDHTLDPGVYIRSMATRGSMGGLARTTVEAADLVAAFGFDLVLVETVGVGQIEHDIVEAADLVLVVVHPGAGDSVQAMKAGLLELADIFVLNKADLPGADRLAAELSEMLELRLHRHGEAPPIVQTVARDGDGVADLVRAIRHCEGALAAAGTLAARRQARRQALVRRIVEERLAETLWGENGLAGRILAAGPTDVTRPYAAADALVARIFPASPGTAPGSVPPR